MSAQERLAWLLETVSQPTNILVTQAVLRSALPREAYALVLYTFAMAAKPADDSIQAVAEAKEMEGVFNALSSSEGITLSPPDRQEAIDQLAINGQWPDSVRDAVKALGVTTGPRWQVDNLYQSEPTLEQVKTDMHAEAVAEEARKRQLAIQLRRRQWDEIAASIRSSIEIETISTLKQIIDAVEQGWSE